MGYDWEKIPQLKYVIGLKEAFLFNGNANEFNIKGSVDNHDYIEYLYSDLPNLKFVPLPGWIKHIELNEIQ